MTQFLAAMMLAVLPPVSLADSAAELALIGGPRSMSTTLVREDPLQVLCFLMASVGLPRLLAGAWQGPPLFAKALSAAQGLDWGIRGLTPRGN